MKLKNELPLWQKYTLNIFLIKNTFSTSKNISCYSSLKCVFPRNKGIVPGQISPLPAESSPTWSLCLLRAASNYKTIAKISRLSLWQRALEDYQCCYSQLMVRLGDSNWISCKSTWKICPLRVTVQIHLSKAKHGHPLWAVRNPTTTATFLFTFTFYCSSNCLIYIILFDVLKSWERSSEVCGRNLCSFRQ